MQRSLVLLAITAAACAEPATSPSTSAQEFTAIGAGTRVSGVPDSPSYQIASAPLTLPPGPWKKLVVRYELTATCDGNVPAGDSWPALCDPYDRLTQVRLDGDTPLVLVHAITPFGGNAVFERDITDYAAALEGTHDWTVYVSTGADPEGAATGTAAGWDVAVTLLATPGDPPRDVVAVTGAFHVNRLKPGDLPGTAELTAPADATHARLDLFTTGHGLVGSPPCDEFCEKENEVVFAGTSLFTEAPWSDCSASCTRVSINGTISCGGDTFDYICEENPMACPSSAVFDRSGWCPGSAASPYAIDLGDARDGTLTWNVAGVEGFWSAGGVVVWLR